MSLTSHFIKCYLECRYAECHYAESRYAECRGAVCPSDKKSNSQSMLNSQDFSKK